MRHVLAIVLFLVIPARACAAGHIVDTAFVEQAIARNAIVWDIRPAAAYARGHLPGAVSIGDPALALYNPNTEDFLPTNRVEKILGDAGIDPSREIVVYGDRGNPRAYSSLFALHFFGAKNAYVFHDGFEGWTAAGKPASTEAHRLPPVAIRLEPQPHLAVTTAQMRALVGNPSVQIVDARTPREYSGEDIRAIRGGHIPGAINIPFEANWRDPETAAKLARKQVPDNQGMSLKAIKELRELYGKLDPEKDTVVYCQSGVRASETAYVLKELGFSKVRVYDSSWLGYGSTLDAPANNVQFFNVGAMNNRMAAMQARLEQLERELAAARAAR